MSHSNKAYTASLVACMILFTLLCLCDLNEQLFCFVNKICERLFYKQNMELSCFRLQHLETHRNNIFLHDFKSGFKAETYTYGHLIEAVAECLKKFEQFNIEKNVGIAVDVCDHSAASCALLLGILNYECHFYCLDFEGSKELFNQLSSSGVKYFITQNSSSHQNIMVESMGAIPIFNKEFFMAKLETCLAQQTIKKERFCYTITTSGSTGVPKVVYVPFECIEPNIKSLCSIMKVEQKDVIFLGSPPSFDPFVVEFFMAIQQGASILIARRFCQFKTDLLMENVTIWQTTPSLFRLLGIEAIRNVLSSKSSLRCLLLGGECFPSVPEIQSWLPEESKFGLKRIFNIYGITEVSCWSTIYEYDARQTAGNANERVPIGKPLDDFTFLRIDKKVMEKNEAHHRGELSIGSAKRHCFIPSVDTDFKTDNVNEIIYRNTGDIVESDDQGNIFYVGRANNCIKRLGKRICLDSLENKIENILNTKVICLWHKECNKLILCPCQYKIENSNKEQVQMILKKQLSDYEQPDAIYYIDNLPLKKHGKVDRQKLLQNFLEYIKIKTPLEIFTNFCTSVIGLQSDSFKIAAVAKRFKSDLQITFIQAGGSSFQALSLATEIAKQLKHQQDQRKLLEMLLSSNVAIADILEFLTNVTRELKPSDNSIEFIDSLKSFSFTQTTGIKVKWRCNLQKCVDSSPTLFENSYVSVGSHSHLLLTLNAKTGEEISSIKLSDRIECPVVFVSSNLAVVGCYDGFLYGFNFINGSIVWKLNVNGMIKAKPLVVDNLIIVSSYADDFNIRAYNLKTLESVWSYKLGSRGIFSSPLMVDKKSALFCGLDGTYGLIQISTGVILWEQKFDSPIFSSAALLTTKQKDSEIVLAEVKGQIHVCNAANGEEVVHFQADGNIFSSLTVTEKSKENKLIIFGCHDGNVYCLNYVTSTKKILLSWKYSLNAAVYSTPILVFDDTILACSTKGLIVLIKLSTSELKAMYDIKADIFSSPCILQNKYIYLGSRDNFLYAIELEK